MSMTGIYLCITPRKGLPFRASILILGLMLAGCSTPKKTIPIRGSHHDMQQLAGRWAGSYESTDTGRSGSILFELEAGADTACGDVIMYATRRETEYLLNSRFQQLRRNQQVLEIRFVEVNDNRIRGNLEYYRDPACNCLLSTVFTGRLNGDTITGTFVTHGVNDGHHYRGTWKVRRGKD